MLSGGDSKALCQKWKRRVRAEKDIHYSYLMGVTVPPTPQSPSAATAN